MLSEEAKKQMQGFLDNTRDDPGLYERNPARGPSKVLDCVFDEMAEAGIAYDAVDLEIMGKRHEAEQYLAGLMGMM